MARRSKGSQRQGSNEPFDPTSRRTFTDVTAKPDSARPLGPGRVRGRLRQRRLEDLYVTLRNRNRLYIIRAGVHRVGVAVGNVRPSGKGVGFRLRNSSTTIAMGRLDLMVAKHTWTFDGIHCAGPGGTSVLCVERRPVMCGLGVGWFQEQPCITTRAADLRRRHNQAQY